MSPEQELMDDLLRQGKASLVGLDEAALTRAKTFICVEKKWLSHE